MKNRKRKSGFTLTEVLISAGILSVGFMLIAGAFPVGVKLTSMATERTIGSIAAQEAVAKIKIRGLDMSYWGAYADNANGLTYGECFDYSDIATLNWSNPATGITPGFRPALPLEDEYYYPSTNLAAEKKYHWSALCKRLTANDVQVLVFVSRLGGPGVTYPANPIPIDNAPAAIDYPEPYMVEGVLCDAADRLRMTIPAGYITYFREGSILVDDRLFYVHTIKEVDVVNNEIVIDRNWYISSNPPPDYKVWVLPSSIKTPGAIPVLGGRWPCVWIFQDVIEVSEFSQIVPVP